MLRPLNHNIVRAGFSPRVRPIHPTRFYASKTSPRRRRDEYLPHPKLEANLFQIWKKLNLFLKHPVRCTILEIRDIHLAMTIPAHDIYAELFSDPKLRTHSIDFNAEVWWGIIARDHHLEKWLLDFAKRLNHRIEKLDGVKPYEFPAIVVEDIQRCAKIAYYLVRGSYEPALDLRIDTRVLPTPILSKKVFEAYNEAYELLNGLIAKHKRFDPRCERLPADLTTANDCLHWITFRPS